ncbi:surface-adhesin E family protein [Advenella sp. FME57]|uniref:surface-adhesin E family protein n=1 Tax=Advenella sp. FME57 TaxID=2742604 RepID=UPI0018696769|nr:surface-adhesin E family protein [Advenella sp. FME57]
MKKFLQFLMFTTISMSGAAHAVNWDLISLSEESDLYIDLDSVKNHPVIPNVMSLWILMNHLSPDLDLQSRKLVKSAKVKFDIDCRFDRNQITTSVQYSAINGMGSVLDSAKLNSGWADTVPGTVGETIASFVCKGATVDGLVPRVTGNATSPTEKELKFKSQPRVSAEFSRAYNKALIAMGDKASTLKADQQQWWKKREQTCTSIPEFLYDACMQKEEKDRIIFLNEMEKAFSGTKSQASLSPSAENFTVSANSVCSVGEKELFMCSTVNAKIISICASPSTVTYRFGPPSKLQMKLTRDRQQVTYVPWDASSRTITSSISVPNTNTSYQVYYEQDRNDTYREGGVRVIQNNKLLTTVQCSPGTISNFYENTKTY